MPVHIIITVQICFWPCWNLNAHCLSTHQFIIKVWLVGLCVQTQPWPWAPVNTMQLYIYTIICGSPVVLTLFIKDLYYEGLTTISCGTGVHAPFLTEAKKEKYWHILLSYKVAPVHESKEKAHWSIIIHCSFTNNGIVSTKISQFWKCKACYGHKQMVSAAI